MIHRFPHVRDFRFILSLRIEWLWHLRVDLKFVRNPWHTFLEFPEHIDINQALSLIQVIIIFEPIFDYEPGALRGASNLNGRKVWGWIISSLLDMERFRPTQGVSVPMVKMVDHEFSILIFIMNFHLSVSIFEIRLNVKSVLRYWLLLCGR